MREVFDYNAQIDRIKESLEFKSVILSDWTRGIGLFQFIGDKRDENSGCLTLIRNARGYQAFIKGKVDIVLTEEIIADNRIPASTSDITLENLSVFRYWQERVDALENA